MKANKDFEKLCDLIHEQSCMAIPLSDITETAGFAEDLDFDQLDYVELAIALEEEFKLGDEAITDEDFDPSTLKTVGDAWKALQKKLGKGKS